MDSPKRSDIHRKKLLRDFAYMFKGKIRWLKGSRSQRGRKKSDRVEFVQKIAMPFLDYGENREPNKIWQIIASTHSKLPKDYKIEDWITHTPKEKVIR